MPSNAFRIGKLFKESFYERFYTLIHSHHFQVAFDGAERNERGIGVVLFKKDMVIRFLIDKMLRETSAILLIKSSSKWIEFQLEEIKDERFLTTKKKSTEIKSNLRALLVGREFRLAKFIISTIEYWWRLSEPLELVFEEGTKWVEDHQGHGTILDAGQYEFIEKRMEYLKRLDFQIKHAGKLKHCAKGYFVVHAPVLGSTPPHYLPLLAKKDSMDSTR